MLLVGIKFLVREVLESLNLICWSVPLPAVSAHGNVQVINKTDLAEAVGADLDIMSGDAHRMRGGTGPVVLAQAKHNVAIDQIAQHILDALAKARE